MAENVIVDYRALVDDFLKESAKAGKAAEDVGKKGEEAGKKTKKGFDNASESVKATTQATKRSVEQFKKLGQTIAGALALRQLLNYKTQLEDLALKLEVTANKSAVVFGNSLQFVNEQAKKTAANLGLTENQFKSLASSVGDLLIPMGFTRQRAAEISVEVVELATALRLFNPEIESTEQALFAVTKALVGQRQSLQSLGIVIDQGEIDQQKLISAQELGTEATEKQIEAQAILDLVMRNSSDAIANLENNNTGLTNTVLRQRAAMQNLKEQIAIELTPVLLDLNRVFLNVITNLPLDKLGLLLNLVISGASAFIAYKSAVMVVGFALNAYVTVTKTATAATLALQGAKKGLIGALVGLAAGITSYIVLTKQQTDAQEDMEDATRKANNELARQNRLLAETPLKTVVKRATATTEELKSALREYEKALELLELGRSPSIDIGVDRARAPRLPRRIIDPNGGYVQTEEEFSQEFAVYLQAAQEYESVAEANRQARIKAAKENIQLLRQELSTRKDITMTEEEMKNLARKRARQAKEISELQITTTLDGVEEQIALEKMRYEREVQMAGNNMMLIELLTAEHHQNLLKLDKKLADERRAKMEEERLKMIESFRTGTEGEDATLSIMPNEDETALEIAEFDDFIALTEERLQYLADISDEQRQRVRDNIIGAARDIVGGLSFIFGESVEVQLAALAIEKLIAIAQTTLQYLTSIAKVTAVQGEAIATLNAPLIASTTTALFLLKAGLASSIGGIVATAIPQVSGILKNNAPAFATGVINLNGEGTETSDSIPAWLSKGESVITAKRTRQYLDELHAIHSGSLDDLIYKKYVIPAMIDQGFAGNVANNLSVKASMDYKSRKMWDRDREEQRQRHSELIKALNRKYNPRRGHHV